MADADVLVVGVGSVGSMALWRLAGRGVRAVGLERFEPGHDHGSGHGESRMIRSAYSEGPRYVPLVREAFGLWRELEAEAGAELLTVTGGLMIGRAAGALVAGALASARAHGLEHEVLEPAAAWLGGLLPGLGLPLRVERQVMTWFPADEPDRFAPERFPVFIRERPGGHGYGLPSLDGRTVKVAIHHGGRPVDPDRPDRAV